MIGLESLRWSLTLVFAVATGFHLVRLLRGDAPEEAFHVVMGAAMIAMIWPWGGAVPATLWITGFAFSTGWFASRAVRPARDRTAPILFASGTAAMVWMSAAPHPHPHLHHAAPSSVNWVDAALGGYLVAAALWWLVRGMRLDAATPAELTPHWPAVCHALMSAGMGLSLLAIG
ncbi:DUF5134 domain-containing protein [Actinoplanes sp. CA-030573]|uniref:DUF5134 domain-containing protein n=1 Tax=Actinoplanes sp. CA-030573 TaxID=3239898 RepID=UPI003D907BC3